MNDKKRYRAYLKAHEENEKTWSSMTIEEKIFFLNHGLYFLA